MSMAWIVVADASRARIFVSGQNTSTIDEIETLTHPEGRLHEQALTSDLPGRSFDTSGAGRHAMGQAEEPKKHEAVSFARDIAAHLEKGRLDKKYYKLVLIAAPSMLGLLRDSLDKETKKVIIEELDKDLTQHSTEDIRKHLPAHLPD